MIGSTNLIAVIIAFPIIQCSRRKTLLAIGLLGTVLTNFMLCVIYATNNTQTWLLLIAIIGFIIMYQLAPGPVILMLASELFPDVVRVKFISVSFAFNWVWNIIIVFTFEYFGEVKWLVHLLYGSITLVLTLILLKIIPETKNMTSAQVEAIVRSW